MQDFLIINCKGYTHDQALVAMQQQLLKLKTDPKSAAYRIFSFQCTPGMDMQGQDQKKTIQAVVPQQPIMVINCTVLLVLDPVTADNAVYLTPEEEQALVFAQRQKSKLDEVCKHSRVTNRRTLENFPEKLVATCLDCGKVVEVGRPDLSGTHAEA